MWLTRPVELAALLASEPWDEDELGVWVRQAERWQLLVGPLERVEREDVPDEVVAVAPGDVGWLVGLTLEGRKAGEPAPELRSLVERLASEGQGVVEDAAGLRGPDGSELPIKRRQKPETVSLLRLSWLWTDGGPAQTRDGLIALLSRIQELLPEALPRRWGLTEPPQNRLDELGVDAFVDFVNANRDEVFVWLPTLPVRFVDLADRRRWKFDAGFAANRLTIDLDAEALAKRGNGRRVARAFEAIAKAIQPFYAEARVLRGFRVVRPYDLQGEPDRTDIDLLNSNLWRGVPRKSARAVVIGGPYLGHWPELETVAREEGGLLIACPSSLTVTDPPIPAPPEEIAQDFDPYWRWYEHRYPSGQSFPAVTGEHPTNTPAYWPF